MSARKGSRDVDFALEGVHHAEVYDADRLEPDMSFTGPAMIEDPAPPCHPPRQPGDDRPLWQYPHRGRRVRDRRWTPNPSTAASSTLHPRHHRELAAGGLRRDVRRHAQDCDERDHLRGARHGHRHHRCDRRHRLLRRRHPGLHRRPRQVGEGDPPEIPRPGDDRIPATSSPPTTRSMAASPISTT